MKRKIVGLSKNVFSWIDKKTGEKKFGLNVFIEASSRDTVGIKVWQLFIDNSFPCFNDIAVAIDNNKHSVYIGSICDLSYNESGYLEEIEFYPNDSDTSSQKKV